MVDSDKPGVYNVTSRDAFGTRVKIFESANDADALRAIADWVEEGVYIESIVHQSHESFNGSDWVVTYVQGPKGFDSSTEYDWPFEINAEANDFALWEAELATELVAA